MSLYQKNGGNYHVRRLTDVLAENREIYDEFKKYGLTGANGKISVRAIETAITVSGKVRDYLYREIAKDIYQEMACVISIDPDVEAMLEPGKVIEHNGYLLTKSTGGKLRQYGSLEETLRMDDEYRREYGRVTIRGNLWKGFFSDMMNVAKEGGVEYKNGKKPVRLICQLAKWIGVREEDIVMDFFSGSATTAHAVMELNALDGGRRKFIMVQLNEDLDDALCKATGQNQKFIRKTLDYLDRMGRPHDLAELGKQRIFNAAERIAREKETGSEHIDMGFRVFRLESMDVNDACNANLSGIGRKPAGPRPDELTLLYHILLDLGLPLTLNYHQEANDGVPVYTVFSRCAAVSAARGESMPGAKPDVRKNSPSGASENFRPILAACFAETFSENFLRELANRRPDYMIFRKAVFQSVPRNTAETVLRTISPNTVMKTMK